MNDLAPEKEGVFKMCGCSYSYFFPHGQFMLSDLTLPPIFSLKQGRAELEKAETRYGLSPEEKQKLLNDLNISGLSEDGPSPEEFKRFSLCVSKKQKREVLKELKESRGLRESDLHGETLLAFLMRGHKEAINDWWQKEEMAHFTTQPNSSQKEHECIFFDNNNDALSFPCVRFLMVVFGGTHRFTRVLELPAVFSKREGRWVLEMIQETQRISPEEKKNLLDQLNASGLSEDGPDREQIREVYCSLAQLAEEEEKSRK